MRRDVGTSNVSEKSAHERIEFQRALHVPVQPRPISARSRHIIGIFNTRRGEGNRNSFTWVVYLTNDWCSVRGLFQRLVSMLRSRFQAMPAPTATPETDILEIMSALSLNQAASKQPAQKKDAAKTIKELPPLRSYQTELLAIAQAADVSACTIHFSQSFSLSSRCM